MRLHVFHNRQNNIKIKKEKRERLTINYGHLDIVLSGSEKSVKRISNLSVLWNLMHPPFSQAACP